MRVLVVGGLNLAQSLGTMLRGFERIGCQVLYLPAAEIVPEGKRMRADLPGELWTHAPDADLLYWWQPQNEDCINLVHDLRVKHPGLVTAGHTLDDPFALDYHKDSYALSAFQVAVTCCEGSFGWYRERGCRPLLGYPPCDPELHGAARWSGEEAADIGFAATNTYPTRAYPKVLASRADIVRAVADLGQLALYGEWGAKPFDWGSLGENFRASFRGFRYYDDGTLSTAYASNRISLNSHVRPDGWKYLNERVTTGLASGAFMLCDRVAGIEETFADGRELALWGDLTELRSKAAYYLKHEDERKRVAACGKARALELFDNARLAERIVQCATG